eukprot:767884-Hanusia_phi.AAC.4
MIHCHESAWSREVRVVRYSLQSFQAASDLNSDAAEIKIRTGLRRSTGRVGPSSGSTVVAARPGQDSVPIRCPQQPPVESPPVRSLSHRAI